MKGLFAVLGLASAVVALPASAQAAPELGHWMVAISVADLDKETEFFKKLGFTVELDTTFGPGIPVRWLTSGNERIELLKIANSQPPATPRAKPPAHAAVQGISQVTLSTAACGGSIVLGQATASQGVASFPANVAKRFYTLATGKVLGAQSGNLTGSTTFDVVVGGEFLFADDFEDCRL